MNLLEEARAALLGALRVLPRGSAEAIACACAVDGLNKACRFLRPRLEEAKARQAALRDDLGPTLD